MSRLDRDLLDYTNRYLTRICNHCGKEFYPTNSLTRYCFDSCKYLAKEERKKERKERLSPNGIRMPKPYNFEDFEDDKEKSYYYT